MESMGSEKARTSSCSTCLMLVLLLKDTYVYCTGISLVDQGPSLGLVVLLHRGPHAVYARAQ
jgi:hypothetical protein